MFPEPNLARHEQVSSLLSAFSLLPSAAGPPPELTVLRQQYEGRVAEQVTATFEAKVAELNGRFTGALDNAIARAKSAGDLATVLALQEDKERVANAQPIPEDAESTPEPVKNLRAIYRTQLAKLEEQRAANHAALLAPYTVRLKELEATLTKVDRVEEARQVMEYRTGLTETGSPAPLSPTPSAATSATVANAARQGGVLKGLGQFMFGNLPVDLSNAEGVSDFVEVKVSHMGWIARRANGEVRFQLQVYEDTNHGIVNEKKAVRVCATEGRPLIAIYDDGSAGMVGTQFDISMNPFPTDASDVVDIDAANGLYLVLHRDGTCSVHGRRQKDLVTGLGLKTPGVIPGVAAMSCSRYEAFFLMKDGSVKATTSFQGDKVPSWAKIPRDLSRGIRALAAGAWGFEGRHFVAITRRGDALKSNGETLDKSLKDLIDVKMGGTAAIVKTASGKWQIARPGDAEMGKLLATALAAPQIIDIDLHNHDNDGKLISRVVLWIEPES